MPPVIRRILSFIILFFSIFMGIRVLLPLCFPFLLGTGLALAAEPAVKFLQKSVRLPRTAAAGIGVSLTFCLLFLGLVLLCGLLLRQLAALTGILPELEQAVRSGMSMLRDWLLNMAERTPPGIRVLLTRNVSSFFSGSSALLDRISGWLLGLASGVLSHVPDGAFLFFTGLISSFMISAKLPRIRDLSGRLRTGSLSPVLEALSRLRISLLSWAKAELKLAGVTWILVTLGFVLLRVRYAPLWAIAVAAVDAFPFLGTGTMLIPWSLICFLRGKPLQGLGMLGIYVSALLTRSFLEPKLVGRQLGLDPLVTLAALYAGYRIWGLGGMILGPILAVTAAGLAETTSRTKF